MTAAAPAPPARWVDPAKTAIIAALAVNFALFQWRDEPTEALDTFAWLVLLVLYDLETRRPHWMHGLARTTVRLVRLVAGCAVVAAAAGYVRGEDWLDSVNAVLWIAVALLFEIELRWPAFAVRRRRWFAGVAGILYGGLAALVGAWAWQAEWFAAYDAALWLAAFVLIEQNMLDAAAAPAPST